MAKAQIQYEKPDDLELDATNPRLPSSLTRTPESMLEYIATHYSIEELMGSIGENGFFEGEPLIAVKENGKLYIVEGNRRLTAIKLINNPNLLNIPSITTAAEIAIEKVMEVPVVIFSNREKIHKYLGNRHISGVKEWSSFAKARYLHGLHELKIGDGADYDEAIDAVARSIGRRRDYVARILGALRVVEIVAENDYFDIPSLGEHNIPFSVFYTAFQKVEIRDYVGYSFQDHNIEIDVDNLANLTRWLCVKDKDGRTVLVNPNNIKRLACILEHDEARQELEQGSSIEEAFRYTETAGDDFLRLLHSVKRDLSRLNSLVAEVDFEERFKDQLRTVFRHVKALRNSWKSKNNEDEDFD